MGARECEMLEFLRERIDGIERAVAVNISPDCLEECDHKGFETIRADLNSGEIPSGDGKFDVAVATEIIEHLHHPYKIIGELRRLVLEEGVLLITVPNVARLRKRFELLFGRDPVPLNPDEEDVHIREFTMESITKLLEYYGFRVEEHRYINFAGGNPLARAVKTIFPSLSTHIFIRARPQ